MKQVFSPRVAAIVLCSFVGFISSPLIAQVIPAPDEKEVDSLIADLGSADPAVRQAASDRLDHAGSEIVPMLQKYVNSDDPEIATRVKRVIHTFEWMRSGALILWAQEGPGKQIGLRAGDVICKVDDTPIRKYSDFHAIKRDKPTMLYVWSAGKVRVIKAPAGVLGIVSSSWDITRGGNDHSRGIAALGERPKNYAEAYRRLRAAREEGMNDPISCGLLSAVAAQQFDRKLAAEVYPAYRLHRNCSVTHDDCDGHLDGLPLDSPHCEYLLNRYRKEPFSPILYHELEDWFARYGRNEPMAAELLNKPWPIAMDQVEDSFRNCHELSLVEIRLNQRRYDEVIKHFDNRSVRLPNDPDMEAMAVQAAIRAGRSADAVRVATGMLRREEAESYELDPALWAFPHAAANGDAASAVQFMAAFDKLKPEMAATLLANHAADSWNQPAAADVVRSWVAARPQGQKPGRLDEIALSRLVTASQSTADEFRAAIKAFDGSRSDAVRFAIVQGMLRFGMYDEARNTAEGLSSSRLMRPTDASPRDLAMAAIDFATAHAADLGGKWKDVRGFVQAVPDRANPAATWILRYDGDVFRADANGLQHFGGLIPPPAPVSVCYPHLRVTDETVAVLYPYGRTSAATSSAAADLTFIFDAKRKAWVSLADSDGPIDLHDRAHEQTALALAIRHVAKSYPALAGGIPRDQIKIGAYHWFEGNILIHVDPTTRKLTDLSAEIGRLAGRKEPAHLYAVDEPIPPRPLLYSDCGVWAFDASAGKLDRVTLGLKDENVMTTRMPEELYGKRADGTILIGVAPQQGGQIFIVDPRTLKVTPTTGFCGLGPLDWYAFGYRDWSKRDPQPWIHAQYLARLATKGK